MLGGYGLVLCAEWCELAGLVQPFIKNRPVSHEGFVLPAHRLVVGSPVGMYSFSSGRTLCRGGGLQLSFLGPPYAFHCTLLLYYMR